jgi:hypothetical protein
MNLKWMSMILAGAVLLTAGCSPSFWGGAAGGVVGTGAGYEYHANQEMKRLDAALKAGTMTQSEYDIRRDQLKRDSVLQ